MTTTPSLEMPDATDLLLTAGLGAALDSQRVRGGANNRVWRVTAQGGIAILKEYFRHPGDPRDRLGAEFAFSRFAWDAGLRSLPRPLARDTERALGLYEFITGAPLQPAGVTQAHVHAAAAFVRDLNRFRGDPAAAALPMAADACLAVADHLKQIESRVARLRHAEPSTTAGAAMAAVMPHIEAAWRRVQGDILATSAFANGSRGRPLAAAERCISPSDFGFHNCLERQDGGLVFLDFEYAGWDDPTKLICDFFCQPQVPAPRDELASFTRLVADANSHDSVHDRVLLLLPGYDVKWCCIMLESCLPVGRERRRFAGVDTGEAHVAAQLDKVRAVLDRLEA